MLLLVKDFPQRAQLRTEKAFGDEGVPSALSRAAGSEIG